MVKVFVSGCYDIIHGGHVRFFKDARALGDSLTVCFAGDDVLRAWKGREPALPEDSRRAILEELRCVDLVVMSRGVPVAGGLPGIPKPWLDWLDCFDAIRPDILVVTEDDAHYEEKSLLVKFLGHKCVRIPKAIQGTPISTTAIRERAGL